MTKRKLFIHCKNHIKKKQNILEQRKNELQWALTNETKSSAGDKHEIGRAMIQLEREKLGNQLAEMEQNFQKLRPLKNHVNTGIVSVGSVVHIDNANYYIALATESCEIESKTYYCISPISPIGNLLLGKKIKEHINFNNTESTIIEIL